MFCACVRAFAAFLFVTTHSHQHFNTNNKIRNNVTFYLLFLLIFFCCCCCFVCQRTVKGNKFCEKKLYSINFDKRAYGWKYKAGCETKSFAGKVCFRQFSCCRWFLLFCSYFDLLLLHDAHIHSFRGCSHSWLLRWICFWPNHNTAQEKEI